MGQAYTMLGDAVMKIIVVVAIALPVLAGLPSAAGPFDTRTFWEQQKQFGR
jgi:hypothetical protein